MLKKINISVILIAILFIVGAGIFLYPTISDIWNTYRASKIITEYDQAVTYLDSGEIDQMFAAASEYNKVVARYDVPDSYLNNQNKDHHYESLLDIDGTGLMGYIEIPSIDVNLPIYHYSTEEILQKGAGHLAGSAFPVGDVDSHSVITAHRGLPSARMFTDLDKLEIGDIFFINILDRRLAYVIYGIDTVIPTDTDSLAVHENMDEVTLVTCTPYGVNTHRLLVHGKRTDYADITYEALNSKHVGLLTGWFGKILAMLIGIIIALVILKLIDNRNKRRSE